MVSSDNGSTINFIGENLITPAAGTIGLEPGNFGRYEYFFGVSVDDTGKTIDYTSLSTFVQGPIPNPQVIITYFMNIGYYLAGASYEEFITTGAPAASSQINPNTSHSLINIYVASIWQR